jgi:hypothetical protein
MRLALLSQLAGTRRPLLSRGGDGCAIKKRRDSHTSRADGVVFAKFLDQHHPVRSIKVAARYFINVASTPPLLRRGRRVPAS